MAMLNSLTMNNSIVQQNKLKVYLSMAVLTFLIGTLGALISSMFRWGLTGTGAFLIVAGIINFIAYFFSDRLVLRVSGAKRLKLEQAPELFSITEELCRAHELPMPVLYLLNEDAMNAFATGRDPKHAAVAVTRGLLEKLSPEEVKAVLAHELSHIRNYDMRLMAVISILAGLISILADIYWRGGLASKIEERDRSGVVALAGFFISLLAPLSAMFIQLAISRRRELLADASGAEMVHGSSGLISALKKIHMDHRPLVRVNAATAHLYLSNPFRVSGFIDRMFSTHPSMEERIHQLETLR